MEIGIERFKGRVVLVMGTFGGIAGEIALAFARRGAAVAAGWHDGMAVAHLAADIEACGGTALSCASYLSKPDEVRSLVDGVARRFGRIDILVSIGGTMCASRSVEDVTEKEWNLVMERTMKDVFLCTQAVLRIMREQGSGRIVVVSKQAGGSGIPFGGPHSAGAKAGLVGLVRRLAREESRFNIRVRAMGLSLVYGGTEADPLWDLYGDEDLGKFIDDVPVGRLVGNREVAEMVLILAAEPTQGHHGAAFEMPDFGWGI